VFASFQAIMITKVALSHKHAKLLHLITHEPPQHIGTSRHQYQLTMPLSASASFALPTLQLDLNLPKLGRVDRELREKDDISDELLLTLRNEASTSSLQLLPDLVTFLPCRRVPTGTVSDSWSDEHLDLIAASNF